MALEAQDNPFPSLLFVEHVDPATPDADSGRLFLDTDGILKWISDAGVVTEITSSVSAAAHIADTSDAHDASAISIADAGTIYAATEVEAALQEVGAAVIAHLADTGDAHDASAVSFAPNGSIAATDVQAAIQEVRDEAAAGAGAVATDAIWDAAGDLVQGTGANTAAKLTAGTAGMFLKSAGAAAANLWAYPPGYEFDYVAITAPVAISATSEATANVAITGSSVSYSGSQRIEIEFYAPYVTPGSGSNNMFIIVTKDGATSIGRIGRLSTANGHVVGPLRGSIFDTPAAGAHTYYVRAYFDFANTGTRQIGAGAAGAADYANAFLRIKAA